MCRSNAGLDEEEDGMEVCGKEVWPLVTNLGTMVPRPFCSESLLVPLYLQRLELLHSLEIGVLFLPQLRKRSDPGEETQRCPRLLVIAQILRCHICGSAFWSPSAPPVFFALYLSRLLLFGRCVFRGSKQNDDMSYKVPGFKSDLDF